MNIIPLKSIAAIALMFIPALGFSKDGKTYQHAYQYQVATFDENLRIATGNDATLGKTMTDAKLNGGSQGIHLIHTDAGNYRVEAPVNKGMTILMARGKIPTILHNHWFLDNVQAGTKVLFAAKCSKPNKKHPNEPVRCTFWFPDPDSTDHEYATAGDFTPFMTGDGSNLQKTAYTLCGAGKLKPEVEAQFCGGTQDPITAPAPSPASAPAPVPQPQ